MTLERITTLNLKVHTIENQKQYIFDRHDLKQAWIAGCPKEDRIVGGWLSPRIRKEARQDKTIRTNARTGQMLNNQSTILPTIIPKIY